MAAATTQPPPPPPPDVAQHSPATPSTLARWTPSLPTSLMGMLNPFASTPAPDDTKDNPHGPATPPSGSGKRALTRVGFDPGPPSPDRSSGSVMFAEPDTRSNSDVDSREGSVSDQRRARKSSKPKTCFSMCHPPPASSARQKLHRRPRSLLQLHKLSPVSRPVPAFDVVPSANFSVRIQRAVTKLFKAKHGLCPNDLVVLQAEKYSRVEEDDEDEEARDVLGLICKGKKEDRDTGKHKIFLANGMEWEAYSLPNGAYEFFATDEHGLGLTVRWVVKKPKEGAKAKSRRQFNFSTITPNSRRHPVIATLTQTELDINDSYKMPDQNAGTPSATPRQNSILAETLASEMSEENLTQEYRQTDDALREIIIMTSIWVTFKEGWSPSFKSFEDKESSKPTGVPGSPIVRRSTDTPPGSPARISHDRRPSSIKSVGSNFLRTGSLRRKANRDSVNSIPSVAEETEQPPSTTNGRPRADSNSTVLVHRAASNRRRNNQPHLSIQSPLNEVSREDLTSTPPKFVKRASWQDASPDIATTPLRERALEPESPLAKKSPHDENDEKRESTATTETTGSSKRSSRPSKTKTKVKARQSSPRRKKSGGGWRRLFCGSGEK